MNRLSCIMILFSIHYVMKAENLLLAAGVVIDVIPVPRDISSDCGMAIEFSCGDLDRVQAILSGGGITIARIYTRKGNELIELTKKGDVDGE